jgi:preprotein translocase subunit YajC
MEGYNVIIQAIGSVGFPIVMSLMLFYYMTKQQEAHASESKEMRDAINSLQVAITKLTDKLTDNLK